jgi:hypothetical protein
MTWIDVATAVSSTAGVLVAVGAIVWSRHEGVVERRHQLIVERHRALRELLAAFEATQSLRASHYLENRSELDTSNEALKHAQASFRAHLHGSPEDLPITRGLSLRHIPYGAVDAAEAAHLACASKIGDPESESPDVMAVRGELIETLTRLREQLSS